MSASHRPHSERILFVISGPSGSGKDSVITCLVREVPELTRVATFTTRSPRPGESEGRPYRFVSTRRFENLRAAGEIFEAETVYGTHRYGSPRLVIDGSGPGDLIMELDPNGFRRVREARPGPTVGIFLLVPGPEVLRQRITARHPEADVEHRLAIARAQISAARDYNYILLNDSLDRCCRDAAAVCRAERIRRQGGLDMAHYRPGFE